MSYNGIKPEYIVVVDLMTGETVEGQYKPSPDTTMYLELYRVFPSIGSFAHTHSINAVAFVQAGLDIPVLGTTHIDYFYGDILFVRELSETEVEKVYEVNTDKVMWSA